MSEQPHTEPELLELIRTIDVRAPDELHRQVRGMVADRTAHRRNAGFALGASMAAVAAVVVLLAVVLGGGGGSTRLTVGQAAQVLLRSATASAPGENPQAHGQLTETVDGVAFPYWNGFGYRASGLRSDRIAGRAVTTVFYTDRHGQRIGYAIAASGPTAPASGGRVLWRAGTAYRVLAEKGLTLVTWMRGQHLCVLAARTVPGGELVKLASWQIRPA
jgi:hypothetical protein